ncbi:MAG TPA: CHRD domain-containing protein [Candidatus Binatia bacterium]
MKRLRILIIVMAGLLGTATLARGESLQAALTGYEESPSVSTVASGTFFAFVQDGDTSFQYFLSYFGLQGTVTQGHIHVAQPGVNGSIIIWLCQTATNPDPTNLSPQCPQGGTVQGTITAANVIAGSTASQQLNTGDFAGAIAAMRAGAAYANVHTNLSSGGEIRGQIKVTSK